MTKTTNRKIIEFPFPDSEKGTFDEMSFSDELLRLALKKFKNCHSSYEMMEKVLTLKLQKTKQPARD